MAAVAKAGLPNLIRCQACRQRIKLERMGRFVVLYSAIGLLVAAIGFVVAFQVLNFWASLLAVTVLGLIYDFLASVVVARTATYTKPKGADR
jgi:hypothetical protein